MGEMTTAVVMATLLVGAGVVGYIVGIRSVRTAATLEGEPDALATRYAALEKASDSLREGSAQLARVAEACTKRHVLTEGAVADTAPVDAPGQEAHRQVVQLAAELELLGSQLNGVLDAFNNASGTLERRVLPQIRKLTVVEGESARMPAPPRPVTGRARTIFAPELKGTDATLPSGESDPQRDQGHWPF